MAWHGYVLLELTQALTAQQQTQTLQALRDLALTSSAYPDHICSLRLDLAKDKAIAEGDFPNGLPTKAQFVTALSNRLGVSQATINAMLTITVFGGVNGTHEDSAAACRDYLAQNLALWESHP